LPRGRRFTTNLSATGGARVAAALLRAGKLPQVVVCGSDAMALGVIDHLRDRGLEVPEDLAVTGFDGLRSVGTKAADLTSVVQPRVAMARAAVRMLHGAIAGHPPGPLSVLCPHSLRIGRSCGCAGSAKAERRAPCGWPGPPGRGPEPDPIRAANN
jgi:LacI family transcriptional regulator